MHVALRNHAVTVETQNRSDIHSCGCAHFRSDLGNATYDNFTYHYFTEIEKNNCFSIYIRSDINKIREKTIKKYDLIDVSNHAKV